jgi:hypothetical protein
VVIIENELLQCTKAMVLVKQMLAGSGPFDMVVDLGNLLIMGAAFITEERELVDEFVRTPRVLGGFENELLDATVFHASAFFPVFKYSREPEVAVLTKPALPVVEVRVVAHWARDHCSHDCWCG